MVVTRRATTTVSSLEAEQGSGNISKTQTKATPSVLSSLRTSSEGSPGCHFTMRDSLFQARLERLSNLPNEPPLEEGNTSQSGEGGIQLLKLMAICTKLSDKVAHLENELTSTKAVYNKALITLTKRGRMIKEIDKDENVNLVKSSEQWEAHETVEHRMDFSIASPQTDDDETLVKTLPNIKKSAAKDKRKAIMQESGSLKKIKKKEMMQISLDEEIAQRFYEEKQVEILRDEEYAQQKMLVAMERAEEKRNKPPTQAQQRTYMSNYLINMGGYTLKKIKQYPFKEIKMLFDNTIESIRRFVPMQSEGQAADSKAGERSSKAAKQAKKESSKKAEGRLKRKTSKAREDKDKRQKKHDDPEKLHLWINWKSYCKRDVGYNEIHKADGSYKTYIFFSEMLNDFDREDLIVLYILFNKKYASTRPGFDDLMIWGDMKVMFELDGDDKV
nr:hypothetical protein [Tanacetum cinerariifolium]